MFINKIGLEAEFFLKGKSGQLLFPGDHGFETDEYIILGEFRALPGKTPSETIGNFMTKYYEVVEKATSKGFSVDISGWTKIDAEFNTKILRKMGTKRINDSSNIYGTDILSLSDDIIEDGKIAGKYISCGLHIHFSSREENKKDVEYGGDFTYSPVKIPITIADAHTYLDLYKKEPSTSGKIKYTVEASASRITKPVLDYIVKYFDDKILPKYLDDFPKLKYRNPGFYELKPWGFEYRSLPFSYDIYGNLFEIVSTAFKLLDDLELK